MTDHARQPLLVRRMILATIGLLLAANAGWILVHAIGEVGRYADAYGWKYWAVPGHVLLPAVATVCAVGCATIGVRRPRSAASAWLAFASLLSIVVWVCLPLGL
ncbi:MAG: hypothetical protein PGN13_01350 [Patulibacter minatonensis]